MITMLSFDSITEQVVRNDVAVETVKGLAPLEGCADVTTVTTENTTDKTNLLQRFTSASLRSTSPAVSMETSTDNHYRDTASWTHMSVISWIFHCFSQIREHN